MTRVDGRMPRSVVPFAVFLLAACAGPTPPAPPAPAPAAPTARAIPGLGATLTPRWLPRSHRPQLGAAFVLTDMPDMPDLAGPAVRYVTSDKYPTGMTTIWPHQLGPNLSDCRSCVVGDFDGDGRDEVLGKDGSDLIVFPLTGEPPIFVRRKASLVDDGSDGPWLSGRACDWNGDGRADLAIARERDVVALTDVVAGRWTGLVLCQLPALPAPGPVVATCGDWDRDGLCDVLLAIPEAGLSWCRNDGTATAPRLGAPRPLWPATPGQIVTALQLHDFDRDGWLDVVLGATVPGNGGFTLRVPRTDRNGIEDADLAAASRELDTLLQERRRAAVGFDEDKPDKVVFIGNSSWPEPPMPAHERALRDRIAALESWPLPMVGQATRVLLRSQ